MRAEQVRNVCTTIRSGGSEKRFRVEVKKVEVKEVGLPNQVLGEIRRSIGGEIRAEEIRGGEVAVARCRASDLQIDVSDPLIRQNFRVLITAELVGIQLERGAGTGRVGTRRAGPGGIVFT
jgi:hypothetical protein